MVATFRSPLSDFRALNYPSAAAQATITSTAGTDTSITGSSYPRIPVVQNIAGVIAAGATAQTPIRLNLIDGTSGGTPVRSWALSAPANQACWITESDLNIPCYTGLATLEFAGTSLTAVQQSVAINGYITSYGNG